MTMRWDIINFFIEKNDYKTYLEIGYYKGWSFDRIECNEKTAVDPNPSKIPEQEQVEYGKLIPDGIYANDAIWKLTSDDFFTGSLELGKWDIIFIDGLHEREQALRDLKNAFTHLSDNGIIIMHDCNPPEEGHTRAGIDGCWTGDVYKAMLDVRNSPEAAAYVVDIDWGVGIVRPIIDLKQRDITTTQHFNAITDWNYFSQNRKELLDLVDISTFLKREKDEVKILQ